MIQLNQVTDNARLDVVETVNGQSCTLRIKAGPKPELISSKEKGVTLATISLSGRWMEDATSGVKKKLGIWRAVADGAGTAGHFRLYNSQVFLDENTCFMQGTISAVDEGGDMEIDNPIIAIGQVVEVMNFTFTSTDK